MKAASKGTTELKRNEMETATSKTKGHKRIASLLSTESAKHHKANDDEMETPLTLDCIVDEDLEDDLKTNEKACLVCLNVFKISDSLYPLISSVNIENRNILIVECMETVFRKKVNVNNQFPTNVCADCVHRILNAFILIEEYTQNQEILQEKLVNDPKIKDAKSSNFELECGAYDDSMLSSDTEENVHLNEMVLHTNKNLIVNETTIDLLLCEERNSHSNNSDIYIEKGTEINEENNTKRSNLIKSNSADNSNGLTTITNEKSAYLKRAFTVKKINVFICDECSMCFITTDELRKHEEKHFHTHKILHTVIKVLECKVCGIQFGNKATLKNHAKGHTEFADSSSGR